MKCNNTVLGLSIAAFLAISMVSISTLPDAFAKKDFTGKPDFIALLDAEQVPYKVPFPAGTESQSKAKGIAHFWFNEDKTQLFYKIKLNGLRIVGNNDEGETPGNGATEKVTKIHLHKADVGVNGPHVLNVFGPPGRDDGDLEVNTTNGVIHGIWDTEDTGDQPGNSKPLAENLDALCNELIYVNVHSDLNGAGGFEDTVGAIRGQVVTQPNVVCD